jgi:hypothetical protein
MDNNAAPPIVEIARCENDNDHTSINKIVMRKDYIKISKVSSSMFALGHTCIGFTTGSTAG